MAELAEKPAMTASKVRKAAATSTVAAASSSKEAVVDNTMEKAVEEFKKEFKCLPGTPLTVVVRCGDRRTATYQEIELPSMKALLEKHRG